MLGRWRIACLGILLLPACLPHTGEVQSGGENYWFDVSKLGYASVRYTDSEGKEQILSHSIARLSLAGKPIAVTVLADTTQLLQAGSDSQQELPGIESPAFAVENFYVIGTATFYLQNSNGKKYFCQLANIALGSKRNFSLRDDCEENAQEADMAYFQHHFNDTGQKLDEDILQIDCEINYGDKKQAIHLAVQNGTIIDDQGRYAFAKQGDTNFKIKCRNSFWHKPVIGALRLEQRTSKAVNANISQFACFKFSDGLLTSSWRSVTGKTADACHQTKEPLSFYFSDQDPTRNDDVPLYLRLAKPFALMNNIVTENTLQQDIRVLTQCDNCLPAWAEQLRCTTTCKTETLAHADKVAAPGTIIDAGASKHYSQRFFCQNETQPLSQLDASAALHCTVFQPSEQPAQNTLPLTSEIIRAGKVCVDFTPTKAITISSSANCHSKLRFFFKAAEAPQ